MERNAASSCDVGRTRAEVDASSMLESIEDALKQSKKLWNASELERKRSEQRENKNSPYRPREEPDDLGGKAVASGGVKSHLECTRTEENKRVIETNALRRDRGPGGHIGKKDKAGGVETDRRRESDGKCIN